MTAVAGFTPDQTNVEVFVKIGWKQNSKQITKQDNYTCNKLILTYHSQEHDLLIIQSKCILSSQILAKISDLLL